jgi:isoleucyl-tRNA synthetase
MAPQQYRARSARRSCACGSPSSDYSGELAISNEILKHVVESYRRIRNTLRFLLANVADFDVQKHALPVAEMVEIDRYALALTREMQDQVSGDYARYQFHLVAQRLQSFCSEDLGAFYLDILKDRLYTCGADSQRAPLRADGAVPHHAQPGAPDGADPVVHRRRAVAVLHREERRQRVLPDLLRAAAVPMAKRCCEVERLRELRDPVRKEIEELRTPGQGRRLAAGRGRPAGRGTGLRAAREPRRRAQVPADHSAARPFEEICREVKRQRAIAKCDRCWHYTADVDEEGLCARCRSNLRGPGETRRYV